MITFKEFVTEEHKMLYQDVYDWNDFKFFDVIKENCKQYLAEIKDPTKVIAYRGIRDRGDHGFISVKDTRTNRQPLDTNKGLSAKIDEWFKREYGIRFRSSANFAAGDSNIAGKFGDVYIMFPIGDYDYVWSPNYSDITEDFQQYVEMHAKQYPEEYNYIFKEGVKYIHPKHLNDFMKDGHYKFNTGLVDALTKHKRNEIMIHCKKYYLVYAGFTNGAQEYFLKYLKDSM